MGTIFVYILTLSISLLIFKSPQSVFDSLISGSTKAIYLSIKLLSIYSIWLSILELVSATKLDRYLSNLLSKIIHLLFGDVGQAKNDIAINLTTNIFGMGNACTPSGISAMQKLDKGTKYITTSMAMLFILNVTSLEVLPTTVIGLLISHGSTNASNIILPTIIATTTSTLCGIALVKLFSKQINKYGDKQ